MATIKTPDTAVSPLAPYQTTATVWDQRPRKYKSIFFQVAIFILVVELAERLSIFGISQGLRNFMVKIGWSSVSASALKSTWSSVCYLMPLLGAYLADERWGRFRTILTFGIWYCVGEILVAIAAYPTIMDDPSTSQPILIIGLFLGVAIGTGCIRANVLTFGADQFNPNNPKELEQKESYFNYFYLSVNVGAVFSYGYLTTLSVDGSAQIPKEYGYFATFVISACVIIFAVIMYVVGSKRYVYLPPSNRSTSTFLKLIHANAKVTWKGAILRASMVSFLISFFVNIGAAFTTEEGKWGDSLAYVAGILVILGFAGWLYTGMDQSFLDASKESNGGSYTDEEVEGFKKMVSVLPYAAFTIIWQCAYDQTDANFQSISQQTDLRLDRSDPNSKQLPGAMLTVFDPIFIVICTPLLDLVVYPLYKKRYGRIPSKFARSAAGLVAAALGLLWAAIFEIIRRDAGPLLTEDGEFILDDGGDQPMNNISWGYATIMYIMVALAECLINVTAYDVFYATVPLTLKSTAVGLMMYMYSVGSIVTSVFTIMFSPYMPSNNLNEGHLEYMFFTVAGVSVLNLLGFIWVMKRMNFGMDEPTIAVPELSEKASASRESWINHK